MGRMTFHLLDAGSGILMTARGLVPGPRFADILGDFMDRFPHVLDAADYWISDYRGFDPRELVAAHVPAIRLATAPLFHHGLVVANHAPGDVEFGMTRMWQGQLADEEQHQRTTVVRDWDVLLRWIGERIHRSVAATPGEMLLDVPHPEDGSST
jgi:hypothetical protein